MPIEKIRKPRVSCTECRRRKQKCDRQWPCIHCRKRRIAQSCHFEPKPVYTSKQNLRESRPSQQHLETNNDPSSNNAPPDDGSIAPALAAWGYSKGVEHFKLHNVDEKSTALTPPDRTDAANENVLAALQALPARSLTDRLVQHYLQNLNYMYYSVHPDSFLSDYDRWFVDRAAGLSMDGSFLGLLLQMCANSAQCADEPLKHAIEYDFTEDVHKFSRRLHDTAAQLGRSFSPSSGGINRVLQRLLAAAWLKGQGRIVEGWHMLSTAVHEAQEFNLAPKENDHRAELNQELRRRAWYFMIVWDWQMAEWLDRPMLIDVRSTVLRLPNRALDGEQEEPSPFEGTFQQCRLVHSIAMNHGRLADIQDPIEIEKIQILIDRWQELLPLILKPTTTDTSWDTKFPWLPLQRALLHCFTAMVRFTPLKQILMSSPGGSSGDIPARLRDVAVDLGLLCISTATKLYNILAPIKLGFHFVIFVLFDTATILCSALLHDESGYIPHRQAIVDAICASLQHLQQASSSKSAQTSTKVLEYLISKLPPLRYGEDTKELSLPTPSSEDKNRTERSCSSQRDTGDWTQLFNQIPLSDDFDVASFDNLDLGGMEEIWDWDALGIDWPLGT